VSENLELRDLRQVRKPLTVRDQKVTRLELYWDREDAISALGLTESERS
jgi:hypothetical protein